MLKVMMYPHPDSTMNGESGIHTLIRKYVKHFPSAGIEIVHPKAESFDVLAIHAGTANEFGSGPMVAHLHGLYWTADYNCALWEYRANQDVISNLISADAVTVPSEWVAQTIRRDTRINPHILPHGIDFDDWETDDDHRGYVLWNKNRAADVCDPTPVKLLAEMFSDVNFISTFAPENSPKVNLQTTGPVPHDRMAELVKSSFIYLATTKETFGIGTLEAMASGVPILGYRHGGTEQIVEHCKTGYLARPNDIEDLARGLKYCMKYREVLGQNARIEAQKYRWENVALIAKEVYQEAIDVHNRPHDVSVVIPSYNKSETVERAIVSATNQTFPPSEIIVVNNNSTDETDFDYLEEKYPVTIINEPKQGVAHARNLGIKTAKTRYICCLDGDDEIEPEFLKVCVDTLKNDPHLGLAYTKLKAIFKDGNEVVSEWPGEYDFNGFLVRKNQVPTCCVFRKDIADRLGGFRQRYAPRGAGSEDAEFWLRIGALGHAGKLATEEPLFRYHVGGTTSQPGYSETDWLVWHPWTRDKNHPFASAATPEKHSHPVRQYDKPNVSVIIPVGPNHNDLVIDALDSLDSQHMRMWEAIVVWDQEGEPPDELRVAYPYVRFIHTGGKGSGYARNRGAEAATARLLLFLDADDVLLPDALQEMLASHLQTGAISYSDYFGRAFIEDLHEVSKLRMMGRLNSYNNDTHEAVIHYESFDFDCEKAQAQPRIESDGQFYIWCLICSLVPKEWHKQIGGFDEAMPSWEDWDYWLRMARAGKCFTRITKPLAQYRFYTGNRRILANPGESGDSGRQLSSSLLKYLRKKYKEIDAMPCSGCGKSKRNPPPPQPARVSSPQMGTPQNMSSSDLVMVELIDGNTGGHKIAVQGTDYGQRRNGDMFLVQRNHAMSDPRLQIVEVEKPVVEEPQAEVWEPEPIVIEEQEQFEAPELEIEEEPEPEEEQPPQVIADDLTSLWGINNGNVSKLQDVGVRTFQGLTTLSESRIASILGVNTRVAKRILKDARNKI